MEATKTIPELAREASDWFTTMERGEERITVTKDGAPEWVRELVHAAHGSEFLPDDWRYEKIAEALEYIADDPFDLEYGDEFTDGAVDVYTHDRHKWLSSNLNRSSYVDEAREEGLITPETDLTEQIGIGQYMEAREVYGSVLRSLEEREEEQDEDE